MKYWSMAVCLVWLAWRSYRYELPMYGDTCMAEPHVKHLCGNILSGWMYSAFDLLTLYCQAIAYIWCVFKILVQTADPSHSPYSYTNIYKLLVSIC